MKNRKHVVNEPIGPDLWWAQNNSFPYAKIILNTCSVLRSTRSVLPNTSRQYWKTDRLTEEPIGSVLRPIYILLFSLIGNRFSVLHTRLAFKIFKREEPKRRLLQTRAPYYARARPLAPAHTRNIVLGPPWPNGKGWHALPGNDIFRETFGTR